MSLLNFSVLGLALAACLFTSRVRGEPPLALVAPPFARLFSAEETGSGPQYFGLLVSTDGLVYGGGQNGLVEFDGQTWRTLTPSFGYIAALATDDQGVLYAGGLGKILRLDRTETGSWAPRDVLAPLELEVAGTSPFFFAQPNPQNRSLWFSAMNRLVEVDAGGNARVVREGAGLAKLIPWDGRLLVLSSAPPGLAGWAGEGKIEALAAADAAEVAGIATAVPAPGGTMAFKADQFRRFAGLKPVGPWRPIPGIGAGNIVFCSLRLTDGRIALGTQRGGIVMLDPEAESAERWTDVDGLPGGTIRLLREDRQGGLWVAADVGLARLQVDSPFRRFPPDRGLRPPVVAFHRHAGRYWAGTHGPTVRQNEQGNFESQPGLPASVWGFCSDGSDLIVAGRTVVQVRADGTNELLGLPQEVAAVGSPLLDSSGQMLLVPTTGGIQLFRRSGRSWEPAGRVAAFTGSAFDLKFSPDGWLWIADSRTRLLRVRWRPGTGTGDAAPENVPLEGANVTSKELRLAVWRETIWVASNAGVHRWNARSSRLDRATELGPIASTRCNFLATPPDGSLWIASSQDVATQLPNRAWRIRTREENPLDPSLVIQDFALDLISPRTTYGLYAEDGRHVYFYGESPVSMVDVAAAGGPTPKPEARVRRVLADRRLAYDGGSRGSDGPLTLALGERALAFEFAAPWFIPDSSGASPLLFRSRLRGAGEAWSDWSTERKREFTNLPPGDYRFEVHARRTTGPEMEVALPGGMGIHLPAYAWETLSLRLAAALVVAALVAWGTYLMLAGRHRRRVEAIQREAALETERLRIARDMHDDLGSSLAYLACTARELAEREPDSGARAKLAQIQQTSVELLTSARDIIWSVNPQNDTLEGLADYLADRTHRILGDAGIACKLEVPAQLPAHVLSGPVRNTVLLAIKEALQNILKHAQASRVTFRIEAKGDEVVVTLTDDGRGFSRGGATAPSPGSGLGLGSIQSRLASVGGSAVIESRPGAGTKVSFRFPLGQPSAVHA